jgi:twitching motility protein PilT
MIPSLEEPPVSDAPVRLGLLGRLALHRRLITRDQLRECLGIQGRSPGGARLGEIMVSRGYLTSAQVDQLAHEQVGWEQREMDRRRSAEQETWQQPAGSLAAVTDSLHRGDGMATGRPPETLLRLMHEAFELGASDIHLHAGARPWYRRLGEIVAGGSGVSEADDVRDALSALMTPEQLARLEEHGDVDFAWQIPGSIRFRVNAFADTRGLGVSLRLVPAAPPSLTDLGLPRLLARCVSFHQGLVLVSGPSSSGKTSTVAALVRLINEERRQNVITVEDPIEYLHAPIESNVLQRQLGDHVPSFSEALRGALRQDPDVIVVGEMRDLETISLAISAAETGHLVLGTMHTSGAVGTIDRVIGSFPAAQQAAVRSMLSESLRAVVSQRLVMRRDRRARVPLVELIWGTPAVANLIREGRTFQLPNLIQLGRRAGMRSFDDSLRELVEAGLVDEAEVRRGEA